MNPVMTKQYDQICVRKYATREEMGKAAAEDVAQRIGKTIAAKGSANVVFASAPSQNEFLAHLLECPVEWDKVRAFHMDEYIGLAADAPQGFGNFLRDALLSKVAVKEAHYIDGQNPNPQAACDAYSALLSQYTPDIICLGIGENGHLAFNDPPVADFADPLKVKIVELDPVCRMQQVNDGCFTSIDQVPTHALTLTMSAILSIPEAVAIVPSATKAQALFGTTHGEISEACPASGLRRKAGAAIYTDMDAGALLK